MGRKPAIIQKNERGQSFTELGISLVFLLMLFAVAIELGWAFYTLIALRDTAQEAASYGAICPVTEAGAANTDGIKYRLRESITAPLNGEDITPESITIDFLTSDGTEKLADGVAPVKGNMLRVSVVINHKIIVPFAGTFLGDNWTYPLTATVTDTIMVNECKVNN